MISTFARLNFFIFFLDLRMFIKDQTAILAKIAESSLPRNLSCSDFEKFCQERP